ncbi:transposase [Thermosynechococcus sp. JY1334]|nr:MULTISPECIES: transposase [unclassified Thermosynechococcus]MDR7898388.1 transposase [Thermosynechococcus sp. JY1332]MDR7905790.1 transposase [Thermosynechococcus sp. JY1334]WKT85527.1 transposase [Thermosynechococcus sp. JY1339]
MSRATIYRWLKREDLAPTVVPRRPWKLDWAALETGFDSRVECEYGWSARGQRIYGERAGKRKKRESVVAGRYRHQKDFIAPMLFCGYLNALGFGSWLSQYCLPALKRPSLLMMDNAPIHPKGAIQAVVKAAGHEVLFLPKYSPNW